jgi:hypothetical protein
MQIRKYHQYVRFREHALGLPVTDPAPFVEEGADIELPPVEELEVRQQMSSNLAPGK